MMVRTLAIVSLITVLSGCMISQPPPEYFTLNMAASGSGKLASCNIDIDRLELPEALSRNNILIKLSATEAEYYSCAQWISRPDELVIEKLQSEFGPYEGGRETLILYGRLLAFEQIDEGKSGDTEGHIKLCVSLRTDGKSRHEKPLLKKTYQAWVPAEDDTPDAVVQALSKGVEQIAAEIAKDAISIQSEALDTPAPSASK